MIKKKVLGISQLGSCTILVVLFNAKIRNCSNVALRIM